MAVLTFSLLPFAIRCQYLQNVAEQVKVISSDSSRARKRLVSPAIVYRYDEACSHPHRCSLFSLHKSGALQLPGEVDLRAVSILLLLSGMVSRIEFAEASDPASLVTALEGMEGWLALNATPAQVPQLLQIASSISTLRRAVLTVQESSSDLSLPHNYSLPASESLACTILRHEGCSVVQGDMGPYRITRDEGSASVPTSTAFGAPSRLGLALGNLYRVRLTTSPSRVLPLLLLQPPSFE